MTCNILFPLIPSLYSHSHDASDFITMPGPLPKFIPIPAHTHPYLTNKRYISPNNQAMINVQNANTQLSQFQSHNSESRTVRVISY